LKRARVEFVELASTLPLRLDETGGFEHIEVLRDGLSRRPEMVLGREARTDLEQGLVVSHCKLIEDCSSRGIGQGLEDIPHDPIIGKRMLARQRRRTRPLSWLAVERVPERRKPLKPRGFPDL